MYDNSKHVFTLIAFAALILACVMVCHPPQSYNQEPIVTLDTSLVNHSELQADILNCAKVSNYFNRGIAGTTMSHECTPMQSNRECDDLWIIGDFSYPLFMTSNPHFITPYIRF